MTKHKQRHEFRPTVGSMKGPREERRNRDARQQQGRSGPSISGTDLGSGLAKSTHRCLG